MQEMNQVKELMVLKITELIKSIFPNYSVKIYGSHATSLCLHWSDIDLVVGPQVDNQDIFLQSFEIKESLRKISEKLKIEITRQWVTEVHYIE